MVDVVALPQPGDAPVIVTTLWTDDTYEIIADLWLDPS